MIIYGCIIRSGGKRFFHLSLPQTRLLNTVRHSAHHIYQGREFNKQTQEFKGQVPGDEMFQMRGILKCPSEAQSRVCAGTLAAIALLKMLKEGYGKPSTEIGVNEPNLTLL